MIDYEILEVINTSLQLREKPDSYGFGSFPIGYDTKYWKISKIKRLFDNSVFTCGEILKEGEILFFRIKNGKAYINFYQGELEINEYK